MYELEDSKNARMAGPSRLIGRFSTSLKNSNEPSEEMYKLMPDPKLPWKGKGSQEPKIIRKEK